MPRSELSAMCPVGRTPSPLTNQRRSDDTQNDFSDQVTRIDSELEALRSTVGDRDVLDDARENLRAWDSAHAEMLAHVQQGDYSAAIGATSSAMRAGSSAPSPSM